MRNKLILFIVIIICFSCKTHYFTNYKITTPKGNFYTNDFVIKNDSIFIVEFAGNEVRRTGIFKISEIIISE